MGANRKVLLQLAKSELEPALHPSLDQPERQMASRSRAQRRTARTRPQIGVFGLELEIAPHGPEGCLRSSRKWMTLTPKESQTRWSAQSL